MYNGHERQVCPPLPFGILGVYILKLVRVFS